MSLWPGDRVFPQSVVQVHVVEGSNAAAQLPLFADLPGHKQRAEMERIFNLNRKSNKMEDKKS